MAHATAWLAAAAVLATSSCASMKAERARREALTARLDALRYAKPLDEVWAEARRMLAEKGYPLAGADAEAVGQKASPLAAIFSPAKETRPDPAGGRFLETGWGRGQTRHRLSADDQGGSCRVVFWVLREHPTEHGRDAGPGTRDVDLELELTRRLDPEAAGRIEAAVPPAPSGRGGPGGRRNVT